MFWNRCVKRVFFYLFSKQLILLLFLSWVHHYNYTFNVKFQAITLKVVWKCKFNNFCHRNIPKVKCWNWRKRCQQFHKRSKTVKNRLTYIDKSFIYAIWYRSITLTSSIEIFQIFSCYGRPINRHQVEKNFVIRMSRKKLSILSLKFQNKVMISGMWWSERVNFKHLFLRDTEIFMQVLPMFKIWIQKFDSITIKL